MPKQAAKKKLPATKPNTANKGINKDDMMLLAMQGKGATEIALKLGCHKSNVSRALKPYMDTITAYLIHKEDPATSWKHKEFLALNAIDADKLKEASPRDQFTMAGIARDKINLFEGRMPIEQDNLVFNVVYNDNRQVNVTQATPQDVVVVGNDNDSDTP